MRLTAVTNPSDSDPRFSGYHRALEQAIDEESGRVYFKRDGKWWPADEYRPKLGGGVQRRPGYEPPDEAGAAA